MKYKEYQCAPEVIRGAVCKVVSIPLNLSQMFSALCLFSNGFYAS